MQKESIEQSLLLWAIYEQQALESSHKKSERLKHNMDKIERYLEKYEVTNIHIHNIEEGTCYLKYLVSGKESYIQIDLKTYKKKNIDKMPLEIIAK